MIANQDKSFPYMLSKLILHCKSGLRFAAILNVVYETKTAKSSRFMLFKIDPGLIIKLRTRKLHHFESKMPE